MIKEVNKLFLGLKRKLILKDLFYLHLQKQNMNIIQVQEWNRLHKPKHLKYSHQLPSHLTQKCRQ